jgi:putative transcriptional regulator
MVGVDSLRGKLLIAAPSLFDFFRRAVVLMVEHTEEGAFGVVLNRPAETTVGEAVPDLADLTDAEEPVRIGGPVGTDSVVMLGEFEDPEASPKQIVGSLGLVDPGEGGELRQARVYAGHAGWGAGQLESELERDAWLVQDAEPGDPFSDEDLWQLALQRRGGEYALLASMPDDPSMN